MKHFFSFLIALAILSKLAIAQSNEKFNQLIAEGDEYSEKKFDNYKALEKYLEAYKINPRDYNVLWKLSKVYVDIGEHLPTRTKEEKQKQLEMYEKAREYAELAIQVNPNGSMGYTRRAIALGRIALFKGVWESIDLVKKVKEDCEKAIQLDPNNSVAYYVLGRTHAKLCEKPKLFRAPLGLGWANYDDAIKNFEKAISLRPTFIMYRLDAAKAYIEVKNYKKAKEHLAKIAELPTEDEDDPQFRAEAKELLEKIKDKAP
ncbi:Tetratricopeptide repeat-containing protein [Candidatus Kryptonium thompsonii]|uniref:Regulator of microtubule dynamics protein 1 n=1 Tax=Candidatus Kryptonium thompsonii TaxID=1633631 RepID=A0A0P1MZE3_9BACT|nr:tetratricopeptide repeat protein [Candidatus Kryptonium thompsoni]CUS76832.1 Tetratricopeptide repeat-containing protein [Candidatus Kryptonium thompsoni]CUS84382.1 Tetratricopeptide repeat-containing protein [Candidatus Kryptonium thompsoni]CUS86206.1 Tetratricopeptide repeat-containing protein [Candidatus Kryptonium thompsoni]CUS90787.1 Tetratricopeptide repeat-containing protein [Candidatus Kryptonium thompsoni]CUS91941.1 Tetratricopeptide repeat-containing protein [Candidatus Kryptonium